MDDKLQKQLYEKYPKLFKNAFGATITSSGLYFGLQCGKGWFDIIDKACAAMQTACDNYSCRTQVEISQVKEKYGGLRIYVDGGDDVIDKIIQAAESKSYKTCEDCGAPGKTMGKGWIRTQCKACRKAEKDGLASRSKGMR